MQQRSYFHPELFLYIGFMSNFLECYFPVLKESNCRHLTTHIRDCCALEWEMKASDFKHIKAFHVGTLEKATEVFPAEYYLCCLGWYIRSSLQNKIKTEEPNPSPEPSLPGYLVIQEHSLAKAYKRDLGEKSCTLPSGRWCLFAHLPRKPSNAGKDGPAKSSLRLANAVENSRRFFCQWLPFSAHYQNPLQWVAVGRRNTPNYLWTLHCSQIVVKVPFFCLSHTKNFLRLRYASFAKSKYHSIINAHHPFRKSYHQASQQIDSIQP